MSRYIDADKLCEALKSMASVQYPDKQNTILGVVSSIENFPTADVVPKSEVAQILENNQICLEIIETQDQTIQIAKANIARLQTLQRKIFEEIERLLAVYSYTDEYGKEVIGVDVEELIAELKKKYIGGNDNG